MFKVGDMVFHPINGAGIIAGLVKMPALGDVQRYYKVKILGQIKTILMVPVTEAASVGLRPAITPRQIDEVWAVLSSKPEELPDQNKTRYKVVKDKLKTGETLQIAEVVRDLTWRRKQEDHLNVPAKRLYKKALKLLTGEVATAQGVAMDEAEAEIKKRVKENLTARLEVN